MRILLVALALALPLLAFGVWSWSTLPAQGPPDLGPRPAAVGTRAEAELGKLQARVDQLSAEVERLALALERLRLEGPGAAPLRAPAGAGDAAPEREAANPTLPLGPEGYLEQYVRSFDGGGKGSEFHRLAVEAYVPVLVTPIARILLTPGAGPSALLVSLARMFADARLAGQLAAQDTLLSLLERSEDPELLGAAVGALASIGTTRTAWALEALVWRISSRPARLQALGVIVSLFGEEGNQAVVRLLHAAPDPALTIFLLGLLQPTEFQAALDAFGLARVQDVPVRLAAANEIGRFHDPSVMLFIDSWLAVETDERVRRALGAARRALDDKVPYSPAQASGAPDADPARDDPRAWASNEPDGGPEWLELDFPTPLRASNLRIHQVNSAGALVEIVAIEPGGARRSLWKGQSSTQVGPFDPSFETTAYRISGVRLVLDTRRAPGWNEIDAVELSGPDGSAFASGARASSYYGQGSTRREATFSLFR